MNESIKVLDSVELIPLGQSEISPLVTKVKIKVFHLGENRNRSYISKETALSMAKTLRGNPIVARFREEDQDFTDHGHEITINDKGISDKCMTKPYGFVDMNAKVWFEDYIDVDEFGNQLQHTYMVTEGYVWTEQYEELKSTIMSGGRPQSMELDEKTLDGEWSDKVNSKYEIFIINDAVISKLCALGNNTEPCFIGSSIVPEYTKENEENTYDFVKQLLDFKTKFNAVFNLNNKGGEPMQGTVDSTVMEESPKVQFEDGGDASTSAESEATGSETPVVPAEPSGDGETSTPSEGDNTEGSGQENDPTEIDGVILNDTDKAIASELDESYAPKGETVLEALVKDGATNVPSSILQNSKSKDDKEKNEDDKDKKDKSDSDNSDNNTEEDEEKKKKTFSLEELQEKYALLQKENEELLAFKKSVEEKEKDELIASFYMLSDEDKKEVIENKSNYSLKEIKAELSMICVDKKVNFNLENDTTSVEPITYNLNAHQAEDLPTWLKAVESIQNKNN